MKILYVTHLWSALSECLFDEVTEIRGMPAFFYPLRELAKNNEIDILIFNDSDHNNTDDLNIKIDWLKKLEYHFISHKKIKGKILKPIDQVISFVQVIQKVSEMTKKRSYDFIYGHGPMSEPANFVARKKSIPFGERRYGDSYYSLIQKKGVIYAVLSQPINYLSYRTRKSFMLATRDGSQIDKAYKRINKERVPFPLYHWLNGSERNFEKEYVDQEVINDNHFYLLYVARFTKWKRQHLALNIVEKLKKKGENINLYYAGQIDDEKYYSKIFQIASEKGIEENIKYIGVINKEKMKCYVKNATACLSFYDPCNLGNVLIEYMTFGGVVISLNDGSLDGIIEHGVNGFLVDNLDQAITYIENLMSDHKLVKKIQNNAVKSSRNTFLSWDERVKQEIQLIESIVHKK